MKISWLLAHGYDAEASAGSHPMKEIGSLWGSWTTWRNCQTDNVISAELDKSQQLLMRAFNAVCNFWINKNHFSALGRPTNVQQFDDNHPEVLDHREDIIAAELVSQRYDLILAVGFNLSNSDLDLDDYEKIKKSNYNKSMLKIISENPGTQWVFVDHSNKLCDEIKNLENVTCDKMENVLKLLS